MQQDAVSVDLLSECAGHTGKYANMVCLYAFLRKMSTYWAKRTIITQYIVAVPFNGNIVNLILLLTEKMFNMQIDQMSDEFFG